MPIHEKSLIRPEDIKTHDELVLEVPEEELGEVAPLVVKTMEGAYELDAPLKVDAKVGRNWLDMREGYA